MGNKQIEFLQICQYRQVKQWLFVLSDVLKTMMSVERDCVIAIRDDNNVSTYRALIKVIEKCTNFYFGTEKLPPKF